MTRTKTIPTESIVTEIKRNTYRKFTTEEKIRLLTCREQVCGAEGIRTAKELTIDLLKKWLVKYKFEN